MNSENIRVYGESVVACLEISRNSGREGEQRNLYPCLESNNTILHPITALRRATQIQKSRVRSSHQKS